MLLHRQMKVFLIAIFLIACTSQTKMQPLKPNSVILAFGDSITEGYGASVETSYPHYLQILSGFTVINAGISGDETNDGVKRIDEVLEMHIPQLVILCLGGNDLLRRRPFPVIKENLKIIIQRIQNIGAQILLIAVPTPTLQLTIPPFYEELAKEFHIPVDTKLLPSLYHIQAYKADYIHFNKDGYKAMAEGIYQDLQQLGALPPK